MEIEIYEPQHLIIPGVTGAKSCLKRTLFALDVSRNGKEYIVSLTDSEFKRAVEFIQQKGGGTSEFAIYFKGLNKWIASTIIKGTGNELRFAIFRENFLMTTGNCIEA